VTSGYHGSKISGSQLSFLSVDGHLDCRRIEKRMVHRFVPKCNHAKESHTCQFFSAIFAGPRFVDITISPLYSKTNHKSSKNRPECYICYSKFSIVWELIRGGFCTLGRNHTVQGNCILHTLRRNPSGN